MQKYNNTMKNQETLKGLLTNNYILYKLKSLRADERGIRRDKTMEVTVNFGR